jgi:hypothetical protein
MDSGYERGRSGSNVTRRFAIAIAAVMAHMNDH